jgi:hypothetical protein
MDHSSFSTKDIWSQQRLAKKDGGNPQGDEISRRVVAGFFAGIADLADAWSKRR